VFVTERTPLQIRSERQLPRLKFFVFPLFVQVKPEWRLDQTTTDPFQVITLNFYARPGEPLRGRVSKLSLNSDENLSRDHSNFQEQNKVFEPSTIIINL
jgi:hypothetical protein